MDLLHKGTETTDPDKEVVMTSVLANIYLRPGFANIKPMQD